VDQVLFVNCRQSTCHLVRNFERQLNVQSACAFYEILERFALYKLHRVEVILSDAPQVEDRRNIWVTDARRRTGFAEKTKPCRFISEISFTDDFQSHRAAQVNVECLVSDAHCTAAQLEWFSIFASHQLVVVKSLC
jgi:hypothetical protein